MWPSVALIPRRQERSEGVVGDCRGWPTGGKRVLHRGSGHVHRQTAELMLLARFVSPAYEAVIVWPSTLNDEVVKEALPFLSGVAVPKSVLPSQKETLAVGVPLPGAVAFTVAVNVSKWPDFTDVDELVNVVVVAACATVCVVLTVLVTKFALPE